MTTDNLFAFETNKDGTWQVPIDILVDRRNEVSLRPSDGVRTTIDLADSYLHPLMLDRFSRICDENAAIDFCKDYGMPLESPTSEVALVDFLRLAASVRWLRRLNALLQKRLYNEIARHLQIYERPAFRQAYPTLFAARANEQTLEDDDQFIYVLLTSKEEDLNYCGRQAVFTVWFNNEGADEIEEPDLVQQVQRDAFDADNLDILLHALGLAYLKTVMDELLAPLHPTLTICGDGLVPSFKLTTPWLVVAFALYKEITTVQSIVQCENPTCGDFFVKMRSDHRFCKRPGCRKAVSRSRKGNRS